VQLVGFIIKKSHRVSYTHET